MSILETFHFLRPWLLLLLPLLFWLSLRWRPGSTDSDWETWMDPRLLRALAKQKQASGSLRLPRALLLTATVLLVLALAGPAWRSAQVPTQVPDDALVLVLDLSAQARVADLSPSRLQRARFKIADLLELRRHGQTALLVYAGEAFTVAPLTDDAQSLRALLPALGPELMPVPGQRLDAALRMAAELIRGGSGQGRIVVFSNDASSAAIGEAERLRASGIEVSAIGLGTEAGAPLPQDEGGFARGQDGALSLSTLHRDALQALSTAGAGRYVDLSLGDADLQALGVLEVSGAGRDVAGLDGESELFVDDGPWLLLLAMPLLALLFRRGWLLMLVLCLQGVPLQAQAVERNWWQRPEQQARQEYDAGEFAAVEDLVPESELAASAAYRRGDYAAAAQAYAKFDSARSHYNRGNALAKAGQLGEALAAYDKALEKQADMPDALANRKMVEDALKQQQQSGSDSSEQSGEPGQQADQGDQGKPEQNQQGEESEQKGEDSDQSSAGDPQDPESEQGQRSGEDQAKSDQDQQQKADPESALPGEEPEQSADEPAMSEAQAQQQREELQQAQRKAMEQALQDQQSESEADEQTAPAIGSGEPVDPHELEKMQAVEQLLRRVPDDPGALLKRKFALEHRRRVLEGEQQ